MLKRSLVSVMIGASALVFAASAGLAEPKSGAPAVQAAPPACAGLVIRDEAGHEVRHASFRRSGPEEAPPFVEAPCKADQELWLAGAEYEILALCVERGAGAAPVVRRVVLRTLLERGQGAGPGSLPQVGPLNWWTGEAELGAASEAKEPAGCTAVRTTVELRERAQLASFMGQLGARKVTIEGAVKL